MSSAAGSLVVVTLALVLAAAARAKLTAPASLTPRFLGPPDGPVASGVARALAAAELAIAALAVLAPVRLGGAVLAGLFTTFAAAHLHALATDRAACNCFGAVDRPQIDPRLAATMTGGAGLLAALAAVAGAPSPVGDAARHPGPALAVTIAAALGALAWRAVFVGASLTASGASQRLVDGSAAYLERRFSRRTVLLRIAVTGSALAVAPVRFLLYPGTALAQISPESCASGECTDGYTAFCCQINHGANTCPTGTFPGGWWMCTDYSGHRLCGPEGVRYYVDCNARPGSEFPGGCQCANGSCENQRINCNVFRYGQCNTHIPGVTPVVCRMVVCENPSTIAELGCSDALAIDDSVCAQDTPCLLPEAVQLAGAGGV